MKMLCKIAIIMVIIMSTLSICNYVNAKDDEGAGIQGSVDYSNADEALEQKKADQEARKNRSNLKDLLNGSVDDWNPSSQQVDDEETILKAKVLIGIIRGIGIVVSVISLMIIGFREMTASAEEKSIIKKSMPGYILGVIMVVAITFIPTIIYEWAKGL